MKYELDGLRPKVADLRHTEGESDGGVEATSELLEHLTHLLLALHLSLLLFLSGLEFFGGEGISVGVGLLGAHLALTHHGRLAVAHGATISAAVHG